MGPLDLLAPEPAPLFGGPPARNAYVELHNLIAAAESPADFGPRDRDRIGRRHGVDLTSSFLAERVALYRVLLDDRLRAGDLDRTDRALLDHVAETLALKGADRRPVHERAFGRAVEQAIADDALSDDERRLLYTLQHTLGFDPRLADGVYGVLARQRLAAAVAEALADGELTPDEAAEVDRLRASLDVDLPPRLASVLAEASARWASRHAPLPRADVGTGGLQGEVGHLRIPSAWWWAVDGSRLAAASPRHREALETGRTSGLRVPERALAARTETGVVVVTDRRTVLLPAAGGEDDVPHYALADVFEFSNGVVIRTTGGRSTFLDLGADAERFVAVARRLARGGSRATPLGGRAPTAAPPAAPGVGAPTASARWRRVLSREVRAAQSGRGPRSFWQRLLSLPAPPDLGETVRTLAAAPTAWEGVGHASVEGAHLELEDDGQTSRLALSVVTGVVADGPFVWVRRRRAYDLLVRLATAADADRIRRAMLRGGAGH